MNTSTAIQSYKTATFLSSILKTNDRNVIKAMVLSYILNRPIRISFSYLYRIAVDHKYLLVFNSRGSRFQPIGGVYKGYQNSSLFNQEIAEADYITKAPRDDFRAILRKATTLRKFYDEFLSGKYRETSYFREFNEELIVEGILPKKLFSENKLRASKCSDSTRVEITKEVINFYHFDIISVDPSDSQRQFLQSMPKYIEGQFLWVDREDMGKHGVYESEKPNPKSIQDHNFHPLAPHTNSII